MKGPEESWKGICSTSQKRLGRGPKRGSRPRKSWEEAKKPKEPRKAWEEVQKPRKREEEALRPRKAGKRPRGLKAGKISRSLGRGPEAHKRRRKA